MDPDELLDYVLGRLVGPRRGRFERRLASDPALAERAARLARNLGRLLDDGRGDWIAGNASAPAEDPTRPARTEDRGDTLAPEP